MMLYVKDLVASAFEEAVKEAFGANTIVEDHATYIISAATIANDGVAVELKADVYPQDDNMTYTWAITDAAGSSTTAPEGVSLSGAALTALESAQVGATFYITCTPSDPSYKAVTREFTVIEG